MNKYKVTLKRLEVFYHSILVEADSQEQAREKVDRLSVEGEIEFDYLRESDILDEHIMYIENQ